jgi:hypothetical protein
MKDYASIPNTTGAFPAVEAINSTTATTLDGTPLLADSVNEWWGFSQALLEFVGATPSGAVEASGASQLLDSLRRIAGHPGEIVFWAGNDDPSAFLDGLRLLLLEGQGVLVADYPLLTAAVYVGDALNGSAGAFYRCTNANGSGRSTTGAYLKLPDAGGRFPRVINTPGQPMVNPQALIAGDVQPPAVAGHGHVLADVVSGNVATAGYTTVTTGAGPEAYIRSAVGAGGLYAPSSGSITGATDPLDNRPYGICAGSLAVRY